MNCYICNHTPLTKILDFGFHPAPLKFPSNSFDIENEQKFPLILSMCENCGLVQLNDVVDPSLLFKEYTYTSSASTAFKNHLFSLAELITKKFKLQSNDLVLDIASNDGTLLQGFKKLGISVLGVEPSNVAKIAIDNGINTVNDFFDENVARDIVVKYSNPKIITATNVFAHIDKLDSMMKGIVALLKNDGCFVSENHYLRDLIEKLEYDTVYHEHLRYYAVTQLEYLFAKYDMEIFDVERISTHGGSIRVYACFKGMYTKSSSVEKIIKEEKNIHLTTLKNLNLFANRVKENKSKLCNLLSELKSQNKKIVGISAPARSCTLLNYCGIDSSILDYIAEKSELKIDKFTPGSYIPVVSDEKLVEEQPDYALLLSWHLQDSIVSKIRHDGFTGKFIIPLPEPKILK